MESDHKAILSHAVNFQAFELLEYRRVYRRHVFRGLSEGSVCPGSNVRVERDGGFYLWTAAWERFVLKP